MPPKKAKRAAFQPKELVLAKMTGFPPWPSFVMPPEMIPPAIIKAKRKTTEWCVIFIPDGDFNWMNEKSLENLSPEKLKDKIDKIPKDKLRSKGKKKSTRANNVTEALLAADGLRFDVFMETLARKKGVKIEDLSENDDDEEDDVVLDDEDSGIEDGDSRSISDSSRTNVDEKQATKNRSTVRSSSTGKRSTRNARSANATRRRSPRSNKNSRKEGASNGHSLDSDDDSEDEKETVEVSEEEEEEDIDDGEDDEINGNEVSDAEENDMDEEDNHEEDDDGEEDGEEAGEEDDEADEDNENSSVKGKRGKRKHLESTKNTRAKRSRSNGDSANSMIENGGKSEDSSKNVAKMNSIARSTSPKPMSDKDRQHQLWLCRIKLQRSLIQRNQPITPKDPKEFPPPTVDELSVARIILHKLADFPVSVELLRDTKIHKVLKCIIKDKDLEYPDSFRLHEKCEELLSKWQEMIDSLKQEKHAKLESRVSSQAPEDSEVSGLETKAANDRENSDKVDS